MPVQEGATQTVAVPVVDVHMQDIDVPIPAVPPMPQLPPPPSLEEILQQLHMALPQPSVPPTLFDGVTPPPPPLDMASLLNPLSKAMDLLGSGVMDDIQTLVAPGGGTNGASATSGGHPLSKLFDMDGLLMSSIERGQRALRELAQNWQSRGADSSLSKGHDIENSKSELRDQGTEVSAITKQGVSIIASGNAQLAAVSARLSAQLVALAPTAFTPWGQAAIVSAIAVATTESEAIIASTEAQLVPVTQQMLAAAVPVKVPQPPAPAGKVAEMMDQITAPFTSKYAGDNAQSLAMNGRSGAASQWGAGGLNGQSVPYSANTAGGPLGGSVLPKAKAALSLAKRAFDAFSTHLSPGAATAIPYSGGTGEVARPTPSEPRKPLSTAATVRPASSTISTPHSVSSGLGVGSASSGSGPSPAAVPQALPTYTAAASAPVAPVGVGVAPGAPMATSGGVAAAGTPGMMPMAPMGAAGAGAGMAGGGGERHKLPQYLISEANGEEIIGGTPDISPAILGVSTPVTPPATTENPDSQHLNI